MNVDGIVAVAVVDLLRNSGCFTPEEAQEYIDIGVLNGLFVLGRTIGFIGKSHFWHNQLQDLTNHIDLMNRTFLRSEAFEARSLQTSLGWYLLCPAWDADDRHGTELSKHFNPVKININ